MKPDEAERLRDRIILDHQALIRRQPDAFLVEMLPTPGDPDLIDCVQLTYLPSGHTLIRVYGERTYQDLREALQQFREEQRRGAIAAEFARRYPYLAYTSGDDPR